MDRSDLFVHAAVRSFATGSACPAPPCGDEWVERASDAGVLSPILAAMTGAGWELPEQLGQFKLLVTAAHLRTMADMRWMGARLDDAGITWAVMKGPALRSVVFTDPTVRQYADLDVLVSPRELRRAITVLVETGAALLPMDWAGALHLRTAELSILLPGGTHLDLHWSLVNFGDVRSRFCLDTDELLDGRVIREVDGTSMATLGDLDLALHTMLHACLSGASTLRWLLDVQQCVRWLDEVSSRERFAERSRQLDLTGPARAVTCAAARYVDPAVASWLPACGSPTLWTRWLDRVSRSRPPSSPSSESGSPHTYFAATGATTLRSIAALGMFGVEHVRYSNGGWSGACPVSTYIDDPLLQAWLELAEGGRVIERRGF